MYIVLFDRGDRLGSNILSYISQILYAYKNKLLIKFRNNSKDNYSFNHSIFVKILFNYIDKHNEGMIDDDILFDFGCPSDLVYTLSSTLNIIKTDFISYFNNFIYNDIELDISNIKYTYNNVPFDVNKTILVHLRLDDMANHPDYDDVLCCEYTKNSIKNNMVCRQAEYVDGWNRQSPLSKKKLQDVINRATERFVDYKVLLMASPYSDTSFFDYDVIKNHDESYDLYLLSLCKVVILSRSNFAMSSLYFNKDKDMVYLPLWGHVTCQGFDTIHDTTEISKYEYFY
jgi:hypothetical protein